MAGPDSATRQAIPEVERSRGTTSGVLAESGGPVEHGDDLILRYVTILSVKCATSYLSNQTEGVVNSATFLMCRTLMKLLSEVGSLAPHLINPPLQSPLNYWRFTGNSVASVLD